MTRLFSIMAAILLSCFTVRAQDATSLISFVLDSDSWTPADYAGDMFCWYDASSTNYMTIVSNYVSELVDRGPRGNTLTQTTHSTRAAVGDWGNGLKCLSLDGNDLYPITGTNATSQYTAFFVVETAVTNAAAYLLDGNLNSHRLLFAAVHTTAAAGLGGTYRRVAYTRASTVVNATNDIPTAEKQVLSYSLKTSDGTIYRDGTSIHTGGAYLSYDFGSGYFFAGYTAVSSWMNGKIGEVIVIPALLSETDRENFNTYLRNKWGTP